MSVKQISIFLENKTGRLDEMTDILGKNNINIKLPKVIHFFCSFIYYKHFLSS